MTVEAWTLVGDVLTLAALNIGLFSWLRGDMKALEADMNDGLRTLEAGIKSELRQIGDRLLAVEKEQARTSVWLEGLGLAGRATPATDSGAD